MDVEEDLEAGLLRQFNCLNTNDKEALMQRLQNLVGVHLNEHTARFYLDMTDWNLQAAVCAYFDLQSGNKLPQMTFLKDVTIGEGESVPPNTKFVKTWKIRNTGDHCWPNDCHLKFTGGDRLGASDQVAIDALLPGHETDISVDMISPIEIGVYSSIWRMSTPQGNFFGDTIWVILHVDSGGTLALMQQMVNLKELGSSPSSSAFVEASTTVPNPFANSYIISGRSPPSPPPPPSLSQNASPVAPPFAFPPTSPCDTSQETQFNSNVQSNEKETPMT